MIDEELSGPSFEILRQNLEIDRLTAERDAAQAKLAEAVEVLKLVAAPLNATWDDQREAMGKARAFLDDNPETSRWR